MESPLDSPARSQEQDQEALISLVNKLQDVCGAIGQTDARIDLPQIVVLGAQSSGKSSVLESIVGRDFLPRGSGICTRRPLVLQLYNTAKRGCPEQGEWAEFLHLPDERFTNFDEVRREIERETDRLTGTNKGISSDAIRLKVYSPNVLTLTLVDLPGITKVPVGDQPSDIEAQIRGMCLEFATNPNAILLAVSPANTDLANSDSLQLVRQIDPKGMRSMGVITKLDLMDEGTDAREMLDGQVIPLLHGYVGVVNRSQKDINQRTHVSAARRKEAEFFASHEAYHDIAHRLGTAHLARRLNTMLLSHIRACLPEMRSSVQSQLRTAEVELDSLGRGPVIGTERSVQGAMLLRQLAEFAARFGASLKASANDVTAAAQPVEEAGARIARVFDEGLVRAYAESGNSASISDAELSVAIENSAGPRAELFVPVASFETLVHRAIMSFEEPSMLCVDAVFDEMIAVAKRCCETDELNRFGVLRTRVLACVERTMEESLISTQDMIANLIQVECAYINSAHPDFGSGIQALTKVVEEPPSQRAAVSRRQPGRPTQMTASSARQHPELSSPPRAPAVSAGDGVQATPSPGLGPRHEPRESRSSMFFASVFRAGSVAAKQQPFASPSKATASPTPVSTSGTVAAVAAPTDKALERENRGIELELARGLTTSLLDVTRRNLLDLVPRTIMYLLVNHVSANLQGKLMGDLYHEDLFDELLREEDDVAVRRKKCYELRELLNRAMAILNEVRDFEFAGRASLP